MSENVPYIWRVNYRNNMTSPEKVLEIAHEKARAVPAVFLLHRFLFDECVEFGAKCMKAVEQARLWLLFFCQQITSPVLNRRRI